MIKKVFLLFFLIVAINNSPLLASTRQPKSLELDVADTPPLNIIDFSQVNLKNQEKNTCITNKEKTVSITNFSPDSILKKKKYDLYSFVLNHAYHSTDWTMNLKDYCQKNYLNYFVAVDWINGLSRNNNNEFRKAVTYFYIKLKRENVQADEFKILHKVSKIVNTIDTDTLKKLNAINDFKLTEENYHCLTLVFSSLVKDSPWEDLLKEYCKKTNYNFEEQKQCFYFVLNKKESPTFKRVFFVYYLNKNMEEIIELEKSLGEGIDSFETSRRKALESKTAASNLGQNHKMIKFSNNTGTQNKQKNKKSRRKRPLKRGKFIRNSHLSQKAKLQKNTNSKPMVNDESKTPQPLAENCIDFQTYQSGSHNTDDSPEL